MIDPTDSVIQRVSVVDSVIDTNELLKLCADDTCGAAALFIGVVRNHHVGRTVRYLEYEGYKPMAEKVMRQIAGDLVKRWDVRKLAIVHRVGKLEIGEVAVAVVVATPHRQDSFDACRFGIDEVKVQAPIWKKEYYEGGDHWVENCEGCRKALEANHALHKH